ncbi:tetratricopeptide repeat protein [Cytophagales bacterium RKSG123]|nr:tetratricopeptide repeat protein [Xanthovirga aplysinae]
MRGPLKTEKLSFEEALDGYNKTIMVKPDYANPYFNRGKTYLRWRGLNWLQMILTEQLF